jgi:hypothetical protein
MSSSAVILSPELSVEIGVVVEVVGEPRLQVCPAPGAAGSDEVVRIQTENVGQRFDGIVRKLTSTGAAVETSTVLPLMSRVALTFELNGVHVEALGIVMWRRAISASPHAKPTRKPAFGVLFEATNEVTRKAIEALENRERCDAGSPSRKRA